MAQYSKPLSISLKFYYILRLMELDNYARRGTRIPPLPSFITEVADHMHRHGSAYLGALVEKKVQVHVLGHRDDCSDKGYDAHRW